MPTIAFNLEPEVRRLTAKQTKRLKATPIHSVMLVECSGPGNVPRNASLPTVKELAEDLEKRLQPLSKLGRTLRESLTDTLNDINTPAKIEVEFGLELGAEAGFLKILSGTSKANFKVTLTWVNKKGGANGQAPE